MARPGGSNEPPGLKVKLPPGPQLLYDHWQCRFILYFYCIIPLLCFTADLQKMQNFVVSL